MNQFTELHNLKKLKFIRDMKREDFVKYFTTLIKLLYIREIIVNVVFDTRN